MSLDRFLRRAAFMSGVVLAGACVTTSQNPKGRSVVDVLFNDFETVYFADGSLFRAVDSFSQISPEVRGSLKLPFAMLSAALKQPMLRPLDEALFKDGGVKSIAVGARNFDFPDGLGPVVFDACFVVKIERGSIDLKSLLRFEPQRIQDGARVWVVTFPYGGDRPNPLTVSIVQPMSDYILIGTKPALVMKVRRNLSEGIPALSQKPKPYEQPEVTNAPLWGYRNYRSPYRGSFRDYIEDIRVDPGATGLVFFWNPEASAVHLRYITSPSDSEPVPFTALQFHETQSGMWEAVYPLLDPQESAGYLFAAFWLLGFGVVI